MEIDTTRRMHPLTAIAAVSVTLFSLAGIAAITGLIPTSHGQPAPVQASSAATPAPAAEPLKPAAAIPPAESAAVTTAAAAKSAASKPAARRPVAKAVRPAEAPVTAAKDEAPVVVAQNAPPPGYGVPPGVAPPPPGTAPPPAIEPPKPVCHECGVIESVREVEKKGDGSGLGAVAGGVAGGLLGHQTGGGHGRDVMTVLGAIGGAFAGNAIEKNVKKVKSYEIAIRFEDGSSRLIAQNNPPAWRSGDKVRLVNGVITAYN